MSERAAVLQLLISSTGSETKKNARAKSFAAAAMAAVCRLPVSRTGRTLLVKTALLGPKQGGQQQCVCARYIPRSQKNQRSW